MKSETIVGQEPEAQTTEKSIAVLPFVNMSSDPEQEYFSDGISEEILNALAKVHELKVAGRTSSFAFKGQNQDLRLIGETLGVNHILEGSVRKAGDRVRITAQLIKVDNGFHMWSESYDRELTDVFAIQDEIARAILEQTKIQLLDVTSIATTRADTLAFDLYLLAKQKMHEREKESLEAAEALLDKAIEADPSFAPAYAQRGIARILLSKDNYGAIPETEALAAAKVWLDRAMELDPGLAESWAGLGFYWGEQTLERDKAIEPLQRALEINPNLINANNWLAAALGRQGELRKAARIYEHMVEVDPLYRPGFGNAIRAFNVMGQTAKARAVIERARPFYPNDGFIDDLEGQQLLWESRIAEGLIFAEAAWQRQPNNRAIRFNYGIYLLTSQQFEKAEKVAPDGWRVVALSLLGRMEEATILARELVSRGESFGAMVNLLGRSEQFEELIEFLESRWSDLDAWEADFPSRAGFGNNLMAFIAHAYQSVGNEEKFDEAMTRLQTSLEHQREQGANNYLIMVSEAFYYMLRGNEDMAISSLEQAANQNWIGFNPRLAKGWPVFRPLEGHPRYEAVQQQILDHLNRERAMIELDPIELDRTL